MAYGKKIESMSAKHKASGMKSDMKKMKKAGKKAMPKRPGASTRPKPGGPVKAKPVRGR